MPHAGNTNVYFYKDVARGQKEVSQVFIHWLQYIKRQDLKVAAVPQIEGLTVEDFLQYAKKKPELLKYLPNENDWLHLDRKWICDVLYTLDTEGIQEMIDKAMKKRRERLEVSQNTVVEMRPEFVAAL